MKMKNKITKIKFELTVLCLALLVTALLAAVSSSASRVSAEAGVLSSFVPSLFYNDRASRWHETTPLQIIDGEFYVPLGFIGELNNIKMDALDNFKENFYIQYKEVNFIAFNVEAGRAKTETKDNIPCKVYIIGYTTYLPAVLVAQSLGLLWEYNEKYNSFRIYELGVRTSFDEILAPYIAKIPVTTAPTTPAPQIITTVTAATAPPQQTAPPETVPTTVVGAEPAGPVTRPPVTEPPTEIETAPEPETTTAENTGEIENYMMFYGEESEIDGAIEMLGLNDIRAAFFFSGDEIEQNPDIARKIYASGHELGIKLAVGTDLGDIAAELEKINGVIYSAIKHKTRFCAFDGRQTNAEKLPYENILRKNGYYLCDWTIDNDALDLRGIQNVREMTDFIKQRHLNVFMFDLGGGYRDYLRWAALAAKYKFYINYSHINNANIENIKMRVIK